METSGFFCYSFWPFRRPWFLLIKKFWSFLKTKFTAFEMVQMAIFETFNLPKLIPRKIWVKERSWKFHTSSNQARVRFFSKDVNFTELLQHESGSGNKILKFPHCGKVKNREINSQFLFKYQMLFSLQNSNATFVILSAMTNVL